MALQSSLRTCLEQMLRSIDDQESLGPRLGGDAVRLWTRVQKLAAMGLAGPILDTQAMELACYVLQLPARRRRGAAAGRPGGANLRDRCEQSAELLLGLTGADIEEALLDRTTKLLQQLPQRSTTVDEARLLADAVNLDDFGVTGLLMQAMRMGLHGDGIAEVVATAGKREQYGYWEARLKDGFHYRPVRELAQARLNAARATIKLLATETTEDAGESP